MTVAAAEAAARLVDAEEIAVVAVEEVVEAPAPVVPKVERR